MSEYSTNKNTGDGASVLITGGSGLIGKYLTSLLLDKGFRVSHLSRREIKGEKVRTFTWDPDKGTVDPEAFNETNIIIHLAGANIGEKRWTTKRKEEILRSRVDSSRLLFKTVKDRGILLDAFISASAVGIYGTMTSDKIFKESDPPADDFLGRICKQWEESADMFAAAGIRTVKIRTAVVLEKNDSALSKLMIPAKFGFLVKTGKGSQYMPWIHINDLCEIYLKAIMDTRMNGPYNAVAPQHVSHDDFMKVLGGVMNIPVFPIPVPEIALSTVLGKMAGIVLKGSRVSDEKILASGYHFLFASLEDALSDVISTRVSR